MNQEKIIFYKATLPRRLFDAITIVITNDYPENYKEFKKSYSDMEVSEFKALSEKCVSFLESMIKDIRPATDRYDYRYKETWSELYYICLSYIYDSPEGKKEEKTMQTRTLDELHDLARKTIAWLRNLIDDIHQTTDDELELVLGYKNEEK